MEKLEVQLYMGLEEQINNNNNNLIKMVPFFLGVFIPLNYLKGMERFLNESTTVEKQALVYQTEDESKKGHELWIIERLN